MLNLKRVRLGLGLGLVLVQVQFRWGSEGRWIHPHPRRGPMSPLTQTAPPIYMHLVLWVAATFWTFSCILTGVLAPPVSMVTGHWEENESTHEVLIFPQSGLCLVLCGYMWGQVHERETPLRPVLACGRCSQYELQKNPLDKGRQGGGEWESQGRFSSCKRNYSSIFSIGLCSIRISLHSKTVMLGLWEMLYNLMCGSDWQYLICT